MNDQYLARLERQIERDAPAIVEALTRIYQLPWPQRPYPTHVVAYANWQGAFSFTGQLMVLSSNDNSLNDRWYPLESVFHEAMHQWDDRVSQALEAQAACQSVTVAADLSHALIFFTVGYVVQRLHPDHEPFLDAANLWRGMLSGARAPLPGCRQSASAPSPATDSSESSDLPTARCEHGRQGSARMAPPALPEASVRHAHRGFSSGVTGSF